jgi:hypothetical protein
VNFVFILYWAYIFDREYLLDYGVKRADYFPWIYFGHYPSRLFWISRQAE